METIFDEIKKRSGSADKKKITLEYKRMQTNDENLSCRSIIITHHNSYPTKERDDVIKEWLSLDKGNMGKIAKLLQGYFHWSVITKIDDKPIKVNILREKGVEIEEDISDTDVLGFQHILTFYNYHP